MSQANTVLTEEELGLVNDCAARLRVIQGDAAAIAADKRCEYLNEEVHRTFKGTTPGRRKLCLEGLLTRFPVAGQLAKSMTATVPVAAAQPVADSPAKLLERLVAAAGALSEEQRTEFARRLYDAGFAWVDRGALELEISKELQTRFGLPADRQPRLERVVQVASLLVQSLYELDRTALIALKELYPRSALVSRAHDFRQATGQYLAGSIDDIEPHLRGSTALLGGMLAAMLGGGRDFGRQFVEKFSPDAIEEVIVSEGSKGFMGPNKKERCWDKYCSLSKDIATPELIDRWLKDCLGRYADSGTKSVR